MEREGQNGKGVRLTRLNVVLICVGLVIAALMAYSMYQTTSSVRNVVTVTDNYMTGQMTGGMLRDMSGKLSEPSSDRCSVPDILSRIRNTNADPSTVPANGIDSASDSPFMSSD